MIAVTASEEEADEAIQAGASGHLLKSASGALERSSTMDYTDKRSRKLVPLPGTIRRVSYLPVTPHKVATLA